MIKRRIEAGEQDWIVKRRVFEQVYKRDKVTDDAIAEIAEGLMKECAKIVEELKMSLKEAKKEVACQTVLGKLEDRSY